MLEEMMPRVLEFEKLHWKYVGSKENAIRELFGLSVVGYYQVLNRVLDMPEAVALEPALVQRLRKLRRSRSITHLSRVGLLL